MTPARPPRVCRFHPDARMLPPVEIIHGERFPGDPSAGRWERVEFCMGCIAEEKPSGRSEFAS